MAPALHRDRLLTWHTHCVDPGKVTGPKDEKHLVLRRGVGNFHFKLEWSHLSEDGQHSVRANLMSWGEKELSLLKLSIEVHHGQPTRRAQLTCNPAPRWPSSKTPAIPVVSISADLNVLDFYWTAHFMNECQRI